jgi:hypothetical protein
MKVQDLFLLWVRVGILLYVQEQKYNMITPYWERLNRLDLDVQRVGEFFRGKK